MVVGMQVHTIFDKPGKRIATQKSKISLLIHKSLAKKEIVPSITQTSLRMSFEKKIEGLIEARIND